MFSGPFHRKISVEEVGVCIICIYIFNDVRPIYQVKVEKGQQQTLAVEIIKKKIIRFR